MPLNGNWEREPATPDARPASAPPRQERWWPRLLLSALAVGASSLCALLLISPDGVSVFWPANGVLLALMITAPRRRWPSYLAAGFLVNVVTHIVTGFNSPAMLGLCVANTVEIWVAALPFKKLAPERPDLTRLPWLRRLVLYGGILGPMTSGLVTTFLTGNFLAFYSLAVKYRLWVTNDGIGMILFAPLTLALVDPAMPQLFRSRQLPKTVALLAMVFVTATLCFGQSQYSFPFLVLVALIPVVFRLGLPGAAIGVLLISIPAIGYSRDGIGPFSIFKPLYASLFLQVYFSILLGTVYVLAAVLAKEKRLAEELRESEARYRALAETSQDLIMRTTLQGARTYVSPSLLQVTGWTEEELPPPGNIERLIHTADRAGFAAFLEEVQQQPGRYSLVFRLRKRNGQYAWLEAYVGTVFDRDNVPCELVWTIRDISLRIEQEENLKSQMQWANLLATTDSLTGLQNRRAFDEKLAHEWRQCGDRGASLAVIMMDVDEFKLYNDSYGHLRGDECLRQIAGVILECIRQPGDMAARYGGEEFAVILPRADIGRAEAIADRIRGRVEALGMEHSAAPTGVVTLSAGVASEHPSQHRAAEILIRLADERLYAAKRAGRNQVALSA